MGLGLLAIVSCEVDDVGFGDELDEIVDVEDRTTVVDDAITGFDCSLFKNYPAPPPWEGPGPHCEKNNPTPPNPGCAPGTEGVCTIPPSGWPGPYNIYRDNCHHAASCGVESGEEVCEDTTGILSCNHDITDGPTGHTINYTVYPAPAPNEGKWVICLSEPQHANPNNSKCCWVQDDKTPDTKDGEPGHACYEHHCHPQADDEGGAVLPVGECWPEVEDIFGCGDTWGKEALECCQKHATYWDKSLKKWCSKKGYEQQLEHRCDIYADCVDKSGGTLPEPPADDDDDDDDDDDVVDTETEGDTEGGDCTCDTADNHETYEAQRMTCDESTCQWYNNGANCFCTWTGSGSTSTSGSDSSGDYGGSDDYGGGDYGGTGGLGGF